MASRSVVALSAALAASAGLNVYFANRDRRASATPASANRTPASASTATVVGAPRVAAPIPTQSRGPGAPPPLPATCEGQLAALGEKLATAEALLEQRLLPAEKFDRSPPAPDQETFLRPLVAKVFEGAPDGHAFDVECRGDVCRVTVTQPERGPDFDWWDKLQSTVFHEHGAGHMISGGAPTHDPVSKQALLVTKAHVQLSDRRLAEGMPVLQALVAGMEESGAIARCSAKDPTAGYLSLQLWLEGETGAIRYDAGGTIPSSANGRCLLGELDAMITRAQVPTPVRGAVLYHTIEVPPR